MFIGHILLESKIYFMFWLISLDIPNLTEDHINYGCMPFHLTADLKAISNIISFFIFHFHFILYTRCFSPRKVYSKEVEIFMNDRSFKYRKSKSNFDKELIIIINTIIMISISISIIQISTFVNIVTILYVMSCYVMYMNYCCYQYSLFVHTLYRMNRMYLLVIIIS